MHEGDTNRDTVTSSGSSGRIRNCRVGQWIRTTKRGTLQGKRGQSKVNSGCGFETSVPLEVWVGLSEEWRAGGGGLGGRGGQVCRTVLHDGK